MKLGVCQTVIRTGFESDVVLAAEAGFVGLGVDMGRATDAGLERAADLLRDAGLEASSLIGAHCDAGKGDAGSVQHAVDVAVAVGSPFVLVGASTLGGATVGDADRERRAWFDAMAPIAERAGIVLALEPFHPILRAMTYVHTLAHAADLTRGRAGTGLVVDLAHLWWDRSFLDDVAANVDAIVTVQVTGVPTGPLAEMRYDRCPPWEGDIAVADLLTAIAGAGYDGWVEDEVVTRMPKEERPAYLAASRRFLAGVG